MATLVLSTVGTMFGGPLGGALGSLVGQAIDQQLFGPPPRRGPRLGDLAVQTSSYGTPIPKMFGTMRVAGTVVWATDLKEEETIQGGGKSGPEVISYAYSASFAVALSSRRASRVGRIWADGKLLRGSAGDFKVPCTFRFHTGSEDQEVDPLIAGIEGNGGAPAFRGLAVAVFEDLALVEFGNRIPMLTFELVADETAVPIATIFGDVSEGQIGSGEAGPTIQGFAAHGSDQRATLSDLVDIWDVGISDQGDRLLAADGVLTVVGAEDRGCAVADSKRGAEERTQEPAKSLPHSLAITYYEAARDYQVGQMRAVVAGGGRTQWRVECPVVLEAAEAKALANAAMSRRWAERDQLSIRLPPSFLGLAPSDRTQIIGLVGQWRVDAVTIEGMVVNAELRRIAGGGGSAFAADPGRVTAELDEPVGRTELALFDLPISSAAPEGPLTVLLAASSAGAFKPVPVSLSIGGQPAGSAAITRRAVLGRAMTVLGPASPFLIDVRNSVEVMLHRPAQLLLNADADALASDANLAVLGNEILQYGRATDLGGGRFRLSQLYRGRFGTEWAMDKHKADDRFLLLDRAATVPVALNVATRGAVLEAIAHGIGDDPVDPPAASIQVSGEGQRPVSVVHLSAAQNDDGSLSVRWLARSRDGFAWVDSAGDPPMNGRRFELSLSGESETWSTLVDQQGVTVSALVIADLGPGSLRIDVVEVGTSARSRAASLSITID